MGRRGEKTIARLAAIESFLLLQPPDVDEVTTPMISRGLGFQAGPLLKMLEKDGRVLSFHPQTEDTWWDGVTRRRYLPSLCWELEPLREAELAVEMRRRNEG